MASGASRSSSIESANFCTGWATRALALEKADERRAQYLREGGVLIK
jgi:hypothetical protein